MEEEIDVDTIKATQLSLGRFVKRPPLTEKLLRKPPFRFLHDIITAVLKSTGFFEGLFEAEELTSDNVKDRESKINFLNKVITVLGLATGKTLAVKPSKIIAGQEPAKTNELLQCLGQALEKKISSHEAVKKFKENFKSQPLHDKKNKDAVKGLKKNQDIKRNAEETKGADRLPTSKNEKTSSKLQVKDATKIKDNSPPKKILSTTNVKESLSKNQRNPQKSQLNGKIKQKTLSNMSHSNDLKEKNEKPKNVDSSTTVNIEINEENYTEALVNDEEMSQVQKTNSEHDEKIDFVEDVELKTTLSENPILENMDVEKNNEQNQYKGLENISVDPEKGKITERKVINTDNTNQKNHEISNPSSTMSLELNNTKIVEKRPQSVRPPSSRPGAPRVKDKHDSGNHETLIVHKVNIISENTVTEEEEDSSIVIVDNQVDSLLQNEEKMNLSSDLHGHLVQQILDSQKEFSQVTGKTEIEWQFGVQKARDVVNQEIEQMRFNVQALSRISNPLGKLIDHIQEDVEVMRQELQEWTRKYEETAEELSKQKIAHAGFLHPLQAKIKQLDADIEDKLDKINDLRIAVFKNYYRIEKLLASENVQ
ncbi:unnamed protein product, partial [Iphiclides podalirius]